MRSMCDAETCLECSGQSVKPVETMHLWNAQTTSWRRVLTSNPSGMLAIVDVNRALTRARLEWRRV